MSVIKLPRGFRFHPTDEELITDFLKPKILETDSEVDQFIAEVDFYKFEPWDLRSESKIESENMWFFFCNPEKYRRTKWSKRTTGIGFWKITGKVRPINNQKTKECIGKKKTLVFHIKNGSATPGEGAKWVMQEYSVEPDNHLTNQSYVLCRLKKKPNDKANSTPHSDEGKPSYIIVSEVENHETPAAFPQDSFQVQGDEVIEEWRSRPLFSPVREEMECHLNLIGQSASSAWPQSGDGFRRAEMMGRAQMERAKIGRAEMGRAKMDISSQSAVDEEAGWTACYSEVSSGGTINCLDLDEEEHLETHELQASFSSTETPPNEVGEEAEMRNSNLPSEYRALVLLVIKILFTTLALLVYDAWKLVRDLSRKRRPFVVLCCAVSFYFLFFRNTSGVSHQHTVVSNPAAHMLPE